MHLLGSVDEQEEKRERARCHRCNLERKLRGFREEHVKVARSLSVTASCLARAPQIIDYVISLVTLEPAYDVAEPRGQTTYIVVKGNVFGPRVGITRNRSLSVSPCRG